MEGFEGFEGFPKIEMWCAVHCGVVWSLWLYHQSPQLKKNLKIPSYYQLFVFACQSCCLQRYIRQSGRWAGWVVPESRCLAINSATATEFATATAHCCCCRVRSSPEARTARAANQERTQHRDRLMENIKKERCQHKYIKEQY